MKTIKMLRDLGFDVVADACGPSNGLHNIKLFGEVVGFTYFRGDLLAIRWERDCGYPNQN